MQAQTISIAIAAVQPASLKGESARRWNHEVAGKSSLRLQNRSELQPAFEERHRSARRHFGCWPMLQPRKLMLSGSYLRMRGAHRKTSDGSSARGIRSRNWLCVSSIPRDPDYDLWAFSIQAFF